MELILGTAQPPKGSDLPSRIHREGERGVQLLPADLRDGLPESVQECRSDLHHLLIVIEVESGEGGVVALQRGHQPRLLVPAGDLLIEPGEQGSVCTGVGPLNDARCCCGNRIVLIGLVINNFLVSICQKRVKFLRSGL